MNIINEVVGNVTDIQIISELSAMDTTACSPMHDKIEADIIRYALNEAEASKYRELIWDYINIHRCSFTTAQVAAFQQVMFNR